jgi:hypothetical protein
MNKCLEAFEPLLLEFPEVRLGDAYRREEKCGGGCCDQVYAGYTIFWNDEKLWMGWLNLEETVSEFRTGTRDYEYYQQRLKAYFSAVRSNGGPNGVKY